MKKTASILGSVLLFVISAILLVAVALLNIAINPLIGLLVGMFAGWVVEWLTGDYVVQAINAVGIGGVQPGDLPKVFGLLGAVTAVVYMVGGGKSTQNVREINAKERD